MNKKEFSNKWNKLELIQQPKWPDLNIYNSIIDKLDIYPNLVTAEEIIQLKKEFTQVSLGKQFVIQGGDCAETFKNFSFNTIKNKLQILLQMSSIIQYTAEMPVNLIGRIAGQYFKPRTEKKENRKGISLPSYRGDGVNSIHFTEKSRKPNPNRLITAYHQSASTMNLIRAFEMQGLTNLKQMNFWDKVLFENAILMEKYNTISSKIKKTIKFINSSNLVNKNLLEKNSNFFTSHEAILLDYENAFISSNDILDNYCGSGHMLWIGDRTRDIKSAHIKFASLIANPIGIKIGPNINIDDLNYLCETLNPNNELNKLVFIIRLGANKIEEILPKIIQNIKCNGNNVIWFCDPMHGNTISAKNGYKTRSFETIIKELKSFFDIHRNENTIPGGVHLELTGEDVTECLGGIKNIQDNELDKRYETTCDPRLNNEQSLEIAFLISELLTKGD